MKIIEAKPTAGDAVKAHEKKIQPMLKEIGKLVAEHANDPKAQTNWGYAGDLEDIEKKLSDILKSLKGENF